MNNQIRIDQLDFADIKENIKEFLRGQADLRDYNFEGSVLSILLDVLAYNTHYNALYTNMAVNEMFLDSASKYSSVASHAKLLGYTPRSVTSAKSKINVSIFANSGFSNDAFLPKGTIFNGIIDTRYFQFIVTDDVYSQGTALEGSSGVHRFYDVPIIEGILYKKRYVYSSTNDTFIIPTTKADITTLKVSVYENASQSNYENYAKADDLFNIRSDQNVFFVKQNEDLTYSIFFGDGKFGKQLSAGNIVELEYVMSSGSLGNGATEFTYQSGFNGYFDSIDVITLEKAWGGAEMEDIESVRHNAPRAYSAADRAVTAEDYRNIVLTNFPYIKDISVWGGQNMNPPQFGKVFITAKPIGATLLTYGQKQEIKNFLISKKSVISVNPEIIDPKMCYIDTDQKVYYNKRMSRRQPGEIKSAVQRSVDKFTEQLGTFSVPFRHSKLTAAIDRSDQSITSNITNIIASYQMSPIFNRSIRYKLDTGNPIFRQAQSIISSNFFIQDATGQLEVYMADDGNGRVFLHTVNGVHVKEIGTVNYQKGIVDIQSLQIKQISTPLEIKVKPLSNDIIPALGYILEFRSQNISILEDSFNGDSQINPNFRFAQSHQ